MDYGTCVTRHLSICRGYELLLRHNVDGLDPGELNEYVVGLDLLLGECQPPLVLYASTCGYSMSQSTVHFSCLLSHPRATKTRKQSPPWAAKSDLVSGEGSLQCWHACVGRPDSLCNVLQRAWT
jgi:hypothetical protein